MIFIDESAAKTNMIRLYGRSVRGERCFDKTAHKWKTITMLSSIRLDGHTESIVFKGALERFRFHFRILTFWDEIPARAVQPLASAAVT